MDMMQRAKIQGFIQIEFPNRQRIFEDSHKIMRTTTNMDVFLRRADEALNFILWTYQMEREGMPLKSNMSEEDAIKDFNNIFNHHIIRIAEHLASVADTKTKKRNAAKKIESYKSMLKLYDIENYQSQLNAIINNLQNDEQ